MLAQACSPDEQKRLTEYSVTLSGIPLQHTQPAAAATATSHNQQHFMANVHGVSENMSAT